VAGASSSEFGITPDVVCKPGSVSPLGGEGIIRLGAALLRRSSALTRALALRRVLRASRSRQRAYSSLLREGLAPPPVTRLSRVGSYPTISTLPEPTRASSLTTPRRSTAIGGVVSVALSLGSPRVAVSDLPALWSPDFPPANGCMFAGDPRDHLRRRHPTGRHRLAPPRLYSISLEVYIAYRFDIR
jgi:hypothetical protein